MYQIANSGVASNRYNPSILEKLHHKVTAYSTIRLQFRFDTSFRAKTSLSLTGRTSYYYDPLLLHVYLRFDL